jgi:hypothetical protein
MDMATMNKWDPLQERGLGRAALLEFLQGDWFWASVVKKSP